MWYWHRKIVSRTSTVVCAERERWKILGNSRDFPNAFPPEQTQQLLPFGFTSSLKHEGPKTIAAAILLGTSVIFFVSHASHAVALLAYCALDCRITRRLQVVGH